MASGERGRRWVRAARDFVVIVVGVLVALSADAWWKGLEDSGREEGYLTALERDLSTAVPQLRAAIETDSANAALNRRALQTLYANEDPETFSIAFEFRDIVVSTGTVKALIGGGDIVLIRSAELRAEILSFDALIERSLSWRHSLEAQSLVNIGALMRDIEAARLRNPAPPGTRSLGGARHSELRASPGVIASISSHITLTENRIGLHRDLLAAVEDLQRALEAALERNRG